MAFYIQGPGIHELMPQGKIFKETGVEKIEAAITEHAIDKYEHGRGKGKHGQQYDAAQAYQSVRLLPQAPAIVLARQIMVSPVETLSLGATVDEALTRFHARQIRHLPVVSSADSLLGIVSERDILHHLSGITENYRSQAQQPGHAQVDKLMKSPVLTASEDTDVRYIARLFVEQRIGALPIVTDGELKGIVTRSDVLSAVMRHFVLQLWA